MIIYKDCSPHWFKSVRDQVAAKRPLIKENITMLKLAQLKNQTCYLGADCGFTISDDGYLNSLFSGAKGQGDKLIYEAIKLGATRLQCFDGYLVKLYERFGFKEVSRSINWDGDHLPAVVEMELIFNLNRG